METRALLVCLSAPAAMGVVFAACNPIFGIVTRTAGPTWCETDAEATGATGYCVDFDRGDAALTTPAGLAATVNATVTVTGDLASSPPNSLEVTSTATSADSGVLAGHLVSFGQGVAPGDELPHFECQVDVYGGDLSAAAGKGVTVGVLAVGGQAADCMRSPVMAVVSFSAGGLVVRLSRFLGPTVPAEPLGAPVTAMLPAGIPQDGWNTLKLMVTPASMDAGEQGPLPLLGDDDAGRPHLSQCALEGGTGRDYILIIQLDGVFVSSVRVPDLGFAVSMMAYGEFIDGRAAPVTIHLDNVRCASIPSGSEGP